LLPNIVHSVCYLFVLKALESQSCAVARADNAR
jgi:hypothetical protein